MKHPYDRWMIAAGQLVALLGCAPDGAVMGSSIVCPEGAWVACACPDGSQGQARCDSDGNSGLCACGSGSGGAAAVAPIPTGGTTSSGVSVDSNHAGQVGTGGSAPSKSDLPCDVKTVVEGRCASCHGATPTFGAPMSLASASDFRAAAPNGTNDIGQRALARIADDSRPMPPPPNARLSASERATLERWIQAGAPAGTCTTPDPGGTGKDPGMTGADPLPPDVTCYPIIARASAANDKYPVPKTPDLYRCFDYSPPWGNKTVQVVSARPIIDNSRVIHHWILYNGSAGVTDGKNAGCSGAHPNASFITGWAPGGEALELPDDVGLRTEGGGFSLEVHYNNTASDGQLDSSGVNLCVTEKLRSKEAAVHWLGTQNLNKMTASGTCVPINGGPVNILSSSPHMHLQGRHMKTVINRKSGGSDVLIDVPFDFNTQISYPTPAVVNPGDTLTTTCTYATPTPFGQKTNEEMCFNFVIAYPAGQLAQFLQLLRKNDCTGF